MEIFIDVPLLVEVIATALRIFAGLTGAFLFGLLARSSAARPIESYFTPVLVFLQGIPALSGW